MSSVGIPLTRVKALPAGRLAIHSGGRRTGVTVPVVGYLVEFRDQLMVFDCGLSGRWAGADESEPAPADNLAPGQRYVPELAGPTMADHVRALGVAPTRLVCSHLHLDHAGGAGDLGLPLEAHREEISRLGSPTASALGYSVEDLAAVELRPLELDRLEAIGPFQAAQRLEGLGIILATPGHTPGSVSLLTRTSLGLTLLCGDAAYPRLDEPDSAAYTGMLALRRAVEDLTDMVVLAGHDTAVLRLCAGDRWL